jgi:hypothetical protein
VLLPEECHDLSDRSFRWQRAKLSVQKQIFASVFSRRLRRLRDEPFQAAHA